MRKIIQLPTLNGVSPGSEATLTLPLRPTYEKIVFELSGTTFDESHLLNIELRVDGNPLQSFKSGTQLGQINDFWGRAEEAGFLTLWLIRPEMANLAQRRLTALGTANLQTLSIHVDIAAGAVAPVLKAHAVVSAPTNLTHATHIKQVPHNSAVSGQVEIDNIVRHPSLRPMAMHFFKADISDIEIEMDNVKIYDASKALSEMTQKQNKRAPVTAACTHVDFVSDGDVGNALVNGGSSDFRIRPTLDTSGATNIVVEYLQGFGQ